MGHQGGLNTSHDVMKSYIILCFFLYIFYFLIFDIIQIYFVLRADSSVKKSHDLKMNQHSEYV